MRHEPWLTRAARLRPERPALDDLTYAELHARAAAAAAVLADRGVRAGDRVAIALAPGEPFAVALHACLLLGAAAVPLDLRHPEAVRARRARGARTLVDAPLEGAAGKSLPDEATWTDDDVLMVVHTSGTTSEPKPVPITYGNVRANAVGSALALGLDPAERWLCPMPLSHVGGLMILLRSVVYGTTALLMPPPFDAAAVAERLNRGDATIASMVPTMLARTLDAGLDHPRALRCLLLGGGPADAALLRRALDAGVPVSQTYGLTEATSQVTVSDPGDPWTAGAALPGVTVRLAADGEIVVEGPVVAAPDGDGVLRTGDLGRLDERGRLTVAGRKADTIVTGGENVAPVEVEEVLLAHPAVAEAAVLGRPDPEWGEAVVAKVVLRPGHGLDGSALTAWCRERLAPFQVPKAFEAVETLPRTVSGKLVRREL
jgi:O-succinylbenzoic acid--CoA ligase